MLQMYAKDVANDNGIPFAQFGASSTWIKLFLRRHKLSFCTRQGQTTTADAEEAAAKFRAEVLQIMIEKECTMVYNADQTAIFFEYLPRKTITSRGSKTVWVKKVRATAMLLGDSEAKLRAKYKEEAFKLKAPGRPIITESITACWSGLSTTTISNGFNKVGLLMDTRTVEEVLEPVSDIDATVEELVQPKASEDSVESDDDIDCIGDDSDGEPD
ncbi:hypothetical protein PPTG_23792 [Phytophthora nicotianae INRA-310]|uniref:HTH CENPB-type domain-containing protein n=1 Tax=Phytophthora nicotianae (strain INRA-310) TaxID=761204 RepID=W2PRC2_PHYN3|nr:hypothetical protein PPTG_23792 [Phytophthora nicotianae INRA-310]ETN03523.1 hypothetical protein PPTG_23792 [Phytophthora nicotianae INRA-310]